MDKPKVEFLCPNIIAIEGTVAGQPALWVGNVSQVGCLQIPSLKKKQEPPMRTQPEEIFTPFSSY